MISRKQPLASVSCYHCGDDCTDKTVHLEEKIFCCEGCKMVYEIIEQNGLCRYYDIAKQPGLSQKIKVRKDKFAFLDNEEIESKLIHFSDGKQKRVTFYLPQMHCSSCIWLLEHLPKLKEGVISATVNFMKKEITIAYSPARVSLRQIAEILTSIGYEPHISLHDLGSKKIRTFDRSRLYKIGIAGFCFGNIMMFSFPEYFASGDIQENQLRLAFNYLNVGLSLPVFFYCAAEFFISAWKGLRQKFLNIDAPIALAILITFARSLYEIVSGTGPGYLDSMSGIVFFMLLGRFFQDKTHQTLTFDRDYTSYFPIGVTVLNRAGGETQIPVSGLRKGDRIRIHSDEIVPADGMLFMGKANIDYSFVTGESAPASRSIGEIIYSGGKQVGGAIELEVIKEVSQSYLTQLWNNEVFSKDKEEKNPSFVHQLSRYFTYVLFSIAALTTGYWLYAEPSRALNALTAILIVACPCALLLSATFTNGNMLTRLQRRDFFLRNASALEALAEADHIVFDKTGTLTTQHGQEVRFCEGALSEYEKRLVKTLAIQSNHPLSKAVVANLNASEKLPISAYSEIKGEGSEGKVDGHKVKLGSKKFVASEDAPDNVSSRVYVSVNDEVLGYFDIRSPYRPGLEKTIWELKKKYALAVISGDTDGERQQLAGIFGADVPMFFLQRPVDKLRFVRNLQALGKKVIMVGDGLNDAGALQQSNAGIVVADDINNFSPACDAILEGRRFSDLPGTLAYCRKHKTIIYGSFIISILYNVAGLSFAVQGLLSPVIAAILMPISSVSIMLYTTGMSALLAGKMNK